jgi:hypothetical protein
MDDNAFASSAAEATSGFDQTFDYVNHPTPPDAPLTFGKYVPVEQPGQGYVLDVCALIDAQQRVAVGTDLNELRTAFASKYGEKPTSPYAFYEWTTPAFQLPMMIGGPRIMRQRTE